MFAQHAYTYMPMIVCKLTNTTIYMVCQNNQLGEPPASHGMSATVMRASILRISGTLLHINAGGIDRQRARDPGLELHGGVHIAPTDAIDIFAAACYANNRIRARSSLHKRRDKMRSGHFDHNRTDTVAIKYLGMIFVN